MKRRSQSFERLYAEHAKALYGFLSYRVGDCVLAEDLLADTFERVLRAGTSFDPRRGSERTWLFAIALNVLRDHSRRRRVESQALASVGASIGVLDARDFFERRETVREALAQLSEVEREALALRYGADLSLSAVADLTAAPRRTVESRIYEGLRKLRQILPDDL